MGTKPTTAINSGADPDIKNDYEGIAANGWRLTGICEFDLDLQIGPYPFLGLHRCMSRMAIKRRLDQ
jgi:hypothetical protein